MITRVYVLDRNAGTELLNAHPHTVVRVMDACLDTTLKELIFKAQPDVDHECYLEVHATVEAWKEKKHE